MKWDWEETSRKLQSELIESYDIFKDTFPFPPGHDGGSGKTIYLGPSPSGMSLTTTRFLASTMNLADKLSGEVSTPERVQRALQSRPVFAGCVYNDPDLRRAAQEQSERRQNNPSLVKSRPRAPEHELTVTRRRSWRRKIRIARGST